jgi:segregation and condensation protein A
MAYEVHLDVYDGPFDLLLQLITAQQVDLYEVRIGDIVDAFVAELERFSSLDLEVATEFLLIAATLVELKCKRLLPGSDDVELDEELALFESRDYLLARLLECKMFSEAAAALAALEQTAARRHARRAGPEDRFAGLEPDLLAGVRPEQLAALAAAALTERAVPIVSIAHAHEDEVTVGETLARLSEELPRRGRAVLRDLVEPRDSTAAFVACFLAVLELYKRELVELEQLETFGELTVSWVAAVEPSAVGER